MKETDAMPYQKTALLLSTIFHFIVVVLVFRAISHSPALINKEQEHILISNLIIEQPEVLRKIPEKTATKPKVTEPVQKRIKSAPKSEPEPIKAIKKTEATTPKVASGTEVITPQEAKKIPDKDKQPDEKATTESVITEKETEKQEIEKEVESIVPDIKDSLIKNIIKNLEDKKEKQQEALLSKEQQEQELAIARTYVSRIRSSVEQHFAVGSSAQQQRFKGLKVRLAIHLDASGAVNKVEVVRSSNDPVFDAMAARAVRKTERFVIPDDPILFAKYFNSLLMDFRI